MPQRRFREAHGTKSGRVDIGSQMVARTVAAPSEQLNPSLEPPICRPIARAPSNHGWKVSFTVDLPSNLKTYCRVAR
jgi:hypothetical protein